MKLPLMRIIIAIFRLICLFFVTLFWFTIGLILAPFLSKQKYFHLVRLWAKSTLMSIGATVTVIGDNKDDYQQPNCMVIANHISWLDIPVVYITYAVGFVARIEIKNWPVLGSLMNHAGTLFIDRSRKRDILKVNQIVSKKLASGGTIGLFPEGETSDGTQVLPFKAGLFENAITTPNCQIIPLVIEYCDASGKHTSQVTYAGEVTLYQTIKNTLLIDKLQVKIHILPKVKAGAFANRKRLSNYIFNQINLHYNVAAGVQIPNNEEQLGSDQENLELVSPIKIKN